MNFIGVMAVCAVALLAQLVWAGWQLATRQFDGQTTRREPWTRS